MLSRSLEITLHRALSIAREYKHEYATFEHLLLALIDDQSAKEVLSGCNIDVSKLERRLKNFIKYELSALEVDYIAEVKPTAGFQRIVHRAAIHAHSTNQKRITGAHILSEFFFEHESYAALFLKEQKLNHITVVNFINNKSKEEVTNIVINSPNNREIDPASLINNIRTPIPESKKSNLEVFPTNSSYNPEALNNYCINLNNKAMNNQIDVLIGREEEVGRVIEVLCRRHKNNPLLVGEPGVGKTAIAEGLALCIVRNKVPSFLKDSVIYALDMGSLVAGTRYRGDFEERIKSIVKDLKSLPKSILFIDEIHTIIGAGATSGGSLDASNLLKPALARGEIHCIGATTFKEYHNHFEKDMPLVRRFQRIIVDEPNIENTIKILKGLKLYYEEHHKVKYTPQALEAAVHLSERYIHDRHLPDKAIDLIDEAGARKKLLPDEDKTRLLHINPKDIESIVSKISHIPNISLSTSDIKKIQHLEANLKHEIFGQDDAIKQLTSNIKLSKAGLKNHNKPIGSYLFAGPTGVGKTELARQLAKLYNMNLIRFDMSEYSEQHSVSKLIGTPPGYVGFDQGGLLTDKVYKSPYSVLLFDEIEKANKDIYNLMLQILDYGKLTDTTGKIVNFTNTIIIMTTNAGAESLGKKSMGFGEKEILINQTALEDINRMFSPEFRNRLDSIIQFNPLNDYIISKIMDKLIRDFKEQLADKNVHCTFDEEAKNQLINLAFDQSNGARVLERYMEKEIKQKIADEILFGKLAKGGSVCITLDKDRDFSFLFKVKENISVKKAKIVKI